MLSTVLAVVAMLCAVYSVIVSTVAVRYAQKHANFSKRVAVLESEFTEMADQVAAYGASLKKLRSRITMRNVRQKRANGEDATELTDKDQLREIARSRGLL